MIYAPDSHFFVAGGPFRSLLLPCYCLRSAKNEARSPRCAIKLSNISHLKLQSLWIVYCAWFSSLVPKPPEKGQKYSCIFESTQLTRSCWPKWVLVCKCAKPTNNAPSFFPVFVLFVFSFFSKIEVKVHWTYALIVYSIWERGSRSSDCSNERREGWTEIDPAKALTKWANDFYKATIRSRF